MKKSVLMILLSFVLHGFVHAQYTWTQKASMMSSRYVAAGFTLGGYGYTGTGYNTQTAPLNDWWRYDPATNSWTQVASMNASRGAAAAFAINGKGYCGLGFDNSNFLTDLQEYDPGTNTWTAKASFPAPGRYGCASFVIGNSGYVCCGNLGSATGPYSNQVFGYDATTNTWSAKAAFPATARYGGRGATINDKGYVFGGLNGNGSSGSSFFNDVWEYDAVTNTWLQRMGISGNGRSYATVFALGNKLIVGNGIHWSGFYETFEAYDPVANAWSPVPPMPAGEARWSATSFTIGNSGYVAVGNKSFNNPVVTEDDLWELTLSTSLNDEPESAVIEMNLFADSDAGTLQIYLNAESNSAYQLVITNLRGQKVAESTIHNGITIVPFNLASGLYLATVRSKNNSRLITQKFIIGR